MIHVSDYPNCCRPVAPAAGRQQRFRYYADADKKTVSEGLKAAAADVFDDEDNLAFRREFKLMTVLLIRRSC